VRMLMKSTFSLSMRLPPFYGTVTFTATGEPSAQQ
jgi:hypothetical protein